MDSGGWTGRLLDWIVEGLGTMAWTDEEALAYYLRSEGRLMPPGDELPDTAWTAGDDRRAVADRPVARPPIGYPPV